MSAGESRSDGSKEHPCEREGCRETFTRYRGHQRFCSDYCRKRAWQDRRTMEVIEAVREEVLATLDEAIRRAIERVDPFNTKGR